MLRSRSVRLKYVNRTPHWSLEHEWHYFNEIDVLKKRKQQDTESFVLPGGTESKRGSNDKVNGDKEKWIRKREPNHRFENL